MNKLIRPIAYYLPQYHPIPENDVWWGKGFTEWTNVAKAKPLFKGHYQPRLPADLGYYDLRLSASREQQADLAREYGVHGFCYYHYWFGNGRQLLERPFNEVLTSGKPDFPFMLCWANQTWKGVWFGTSTGKVLIEQTYPGKEDYINHFNYLIQAFNDPRYIRINQMPVFQVYMPMDIQSLSEFVDTFRDCAHQAGLPGIYLLASNCPPSWNPHQHGFDGVISNNFHNVRMEAARIVADRKSIAGRLETKLRKFMGDRRNVEERSKPFTLKYDEMTELISRWPAVDFDYFPQIVPDWDNSARAGLKSFIVKGSTPEKWATQVKMAVDYVEKFERDKQLIFIKSWNEWAEGNYLEPDQKWGHAYLEVVKSITRI